MDFAVSQPSANGCSLDLNYSSSIVGSQCEGGNWGGFLQGSCCGVAFGEYLYALGQRANQTGLVYLNYTQQRDCLDSMSPLFGCGIEKLTSGAGGCSDFSVADVNHFLGDKLKSFSKSCELVSSEGKQEQFCGSCVKSWEGIRAIHSTSSNAESIEKDLCRFAVLVTFTSSKIEYKAYIRSLYKCLGENIDSSRNHTAAVRKFNTISKDTWILIGGLVGVLSMVLIAACILSKRYIKSTPLPTAASPENKVFKDVFIKDNACPVVPIKEVYHATNNLCESNFIGEGTAGKVYKGILSNNQAVAIKHIINDGNVETFVREVTSLSHIRHPNLVALLGCCVKDDECFLIYELCPYGSLSEWLFGKDKVLSWTKRLEIAIDSARSLWFLHTYPEGCIVHRDFKPTNILLGENFEAKLSDFGLSKVIEQGETYVSSEVRGTFGYVDPDYQNNNRVKSSGDVYSFGIVLLQIISGKKVINLSQKKPMPLSKMAKVLIKGGNITEFADPKLEGKYSVEAFGLTLHLALSCTALNQQRPSMEQIVEKLEEALQISTRTKSYTPETTPE
ncbi:probable serine/threonine-protein kinase PBL5 [Ziziphus jujuba]|uniref:Probable serine/threonine-protein kinase PBL5 n=1 Tax=Ziziphus jujuba TaxID=326968 RepID=A0ABM4A5Y4_ZIZJJ|nr:probable serine/threonine-protein kinase PBL5 [Ziziphus jujuba]XP_060672145.1 probable serine/threonine-protein kinase PBL5 [Ziziphus jujuba]